MSLLEMQRCTAEHAEIAEVFLCDLGGPGG